MLTVVIRRSEDPKIIQLTQANIVKELWQINGAEMLLEDSWNQGIRKVRTPFVCLVEADCTMSAQYLSSNFGIMKKTSTTAAGRGGGYTKLAMIASCLGINSFENRIYNYRMDMEYRTQGPVKVGFPIIVPNKEKPSPTLYHAQVGFVPGAIIRMSALNRDIDNIDSDQPNLVQLSSEVSFHFWNTGRRIKVNPNTTYVSTQEYLESSQSYDPKLPDIAFNIFNRESI